MRDGRLSGTGGRPIHRAGLKTWLAPNRNPRCRWSAVLPAATPAIFCLAVRPSRAGLTCRAVSFAPSDAKKSVVRPKQEAAYPPMGSGA